MAKKTTSKKPIVKDDPSRIIQTSVEDVMHASMIPYAEHVILERALPRVEDGLKPVQRRILYTMMELGTTPDKPHRKCARIVGDCLGKYHPHGDSSVYDAMVRMAQDFSLRGLLVDGHGNFGSIDGDSAAAMRYTEARMTPLAMQMLRDIEKNTVPFRLNFDDTLKEPDMLPARFPNLLVNGANGIAVGLATNIPPHNLGEAIRATIAQIDDPDITLEQLMTYIPGPDFPTGGIVLKNEEVAAGYRTGRGKLTVRAKVHVEDSTAGRKLLVITEVPYQVNKAAMLKKIQELTEKKKQILGCIYDIRDESDREGMRAVVELKRDTDPEKILNYLYKYSDLQVTFGVNMVAIADGKPVQMSLKAMIGYYIAHQKNVVTRRTRYDLEQAKARAHILEGLMIAVDNLDEVIALIRASKNPKEARARLVERFALSEIQAQAILDMRLQRLTNLEVLALRKEYEELQKTINRLEGILKSEKKLMAEIKKELQAVMEEYSDERRTVMQDPEEIPAEMPEEAPVAEEAVVAFTASGQFKRMYPANFRKNPLPEDGPDSARWLFQTATDETLLILTDKAMCYQLSVSALTEVQPKARGQLPAGILQGWEDDETPLLILCGKQAELAKAPDLLMVTKRGVIKRSKMEDYLIRSKRYPAMNVKDGDGLLCILQASEEDVLLVTRQAMVIRFPLEAVSLQSRTASGVKGMVPDPQDEVIAMLQLKDKEELVLVSDRGYGKRIPAMSFEKQGRGGRGVRCFAFNKNGSNGREIGGLCKCGEDTEVFLVTQKTSPETRLIRAMVPLQEKTGKGAFLVMALMDDVVTNIRPEPIKEQQ